ncbi:hypothetical protein CAEBREN_22134 [Caenorhabditis brenneri]|uniref:Uncharacterized protein n=1 Tax=Caenorhabditis brenneri TaxID=135651 RepID=G0MSG0_CAEBE|nr:hypothetical protein CAEBREN_22134 [Caenorhabditis brenneri]
MSDLDFYDSGEEDYDIAGHEAVIEEAIQHQVDEVDGFGNLRMTLLIKAVEIIFQRHAAQRSQARKFVFSHYFESTGLSIQQLPLAQLLIYLQELQGRKDESLEFIKYFQTQRRDDFHPCTIGAVREELVTISQRLEEAKLELDSR